VQNTAAMRAQTQEDPPTKTAPPAIPAPDPTGDPLFDRAQTVWHGVVAELSALSPTMAMKLASTTVKSFAENRLEIGFDRRIELDSLIEGTKGEKRRQAIQDAVRKHAGEVWNVEYSVSPKSNGAASAPAVELPVEGERLVELAKDVLGGV
jgi:hypothetical protein